MTSDSAKKWREWDNLRQRAENLVAEKKPASEEALATAKDLVHELTVHQIELELQNHELQNTQLELTRSRNAFQQLFEFAPIGYLSLNQQGLVLESNLAGAELFDIPRRRLIRRPIMTYIASEDHQRFFTNLRLAFQDESKESFEVEIRTRNKELKRVQFRMQMLHDPELGESKCLCTMENVTELRRNQEELERSLKLVEQANQAKSEFLANMSHEIRTPINGVMGMLQLMLTTTLDDDQSEFTQKAIQSCKRLNKLLGNLLDLSCIESGNLQMSFERFDLRDVFESVHQLFDLAAQQKGLELDFSVNNPLAHHLIGDTVRLEQILNNLVGNAIKYTISGKVSVEATPTPSDDPNFMLVKFAVHDTGIGIDEDKLGSLFEPFIQGHDEGQQKFQGAGLGLSICKRLIDLLGGDISLHSQLGKGTTVEFNLSFKIADAIEPDMLENESAKICNSGGCEILVAEDDPVSSFAIKWLLEDEGYSVTTVENGAKVIETLGTGKFNFIIMDVQMPIMDGIDATKAIREGKAGKRNANIPIIALTALALNGDKDRFIEAGMNDYMSKPVNIEDLKTILNQLPRLP